MAPRRWVVNASPLILLGKTNHLGLLGALTDQLVVPKAVVEEIGAKPDGKTLLRVIAEEPVYTLVDNEEATPDILGWDLGAGETQVIANAQSHGAERVVIDDLEGRRCAKAMGLKVIGTLGIVGRAKAMGLIDQAEPVVRRLQETGLYASDDLVRRLLREVGE
jgi:predicted nucleic acid-binding protein